MNDDKRIVLKNGDMELEIAAGVGGSISQLGFWQEKDNKKEFIPLLRGLASKADTSNSLIAGDMGVHVGVPYINRVEPCQYQGRTIGAEQNHPFVEHNIHGDAWQKAWQVDAVDDKSVVLSYDHDGKTGFPFKYKSIQKISLAKNAFAIEVEIINQEKEASFPAGIGLHFYWTKTDNMILTANNDKLQFDVKTDKPSAQERDVPSNLNCSKGKEVNSLYGLDANFTNKDGKFTIDYPEFDRQLTVSTQGNYKRNYLTICVPDWTDALCVEPLTHSVYGVSEVAKGNKSPAQTGVVLLAPNQKLRMTTKTQIAPLSLEKNKKNAVNLCRAIKQNQR